jgi:glycosyltransferase involved in cell wall biosynthesis
MNNNLAIVITTRNRLNSIDSLLKSIERNTIHPNVISIVSSGQPVDAVINRYKKSLMIIHTHSAKPGQLFQRKMALEQVVSSNELIIFLDDYVILDANFISKCLNSFSELDDQIVGMGITVKNYAQLVPKFPLIRKFLHNYSNKPGVVLKSGINMPYQNLLKFSNTEWLNGTSIWRSFIFDEFSHVQMTSKYSALEDLIFSYPIGKKFKLVTNSDLLVEYGEREIHPKEYITRSISINLHRLYFVEQYAEFSKFWYYVNFLMSSLLMIIKFSIKPTSVNLYHILGHLKSAYLLAKYETMKLFKITDSYWLINWN